MRKITEETAVAFITGVSKRISNTVVEVNDGETTLSLHGNVIAIKNEDEIEINNQGYATHTTKERLNGILAYLNKGRIKQIKGQWYLISPDGKKKEFPNNEWIAI